MSKQTLKQAVYLIENVDCEMARCCQLDGVPLGDGRAHQARLQLADALPAKHARSYTVGDLVSALYDTSGDRYVRRDVAAV